MKKFKIFDWLSVLNDNMERIYQDLFKSKMSWSSLPQYIV